MTTFSQFSEISELFNFAKLGFIPGFCLFSISVDCVEGAGQWWQNQTAKKLQEFWPIYQMNDRTYKTKGADDKIYVQLKYHSFIVGWYKLPECCQYCGRRPQEGISKTKEKVAAGVKMYIDI